MNATALLSLLSGLGFGLSLIIAIGAQNVFVLRQGLRTEHVLPVVVVCAVSDVVLIAAGIAGLGTLINQHPVLVTVARIAGAVFILGYAAMAAMRVVRPRPLITDTDGGRATLSAVVGTALALTWLNPHVYLDTVVLLGSVAAVHGPTRWWFGAGAAAASLLWFFGIGFGARYLRPFFATASAWRVLDFGIAVVMTLLAVSLVVSA